jgi:hypothetical protein
VSEGKNIHKMISLTHSDQQKAEKYKLCLTTELSKIERKMRKIVTWLPSHID